MKLEQQTQDVKPKGFLGQDGNAFTPKSPALQTNGFIVSEAEKLPVVPKEFSALKQIERNGLLMPARHDWEELYRRWAALPFEQKRSLVQWENLGATRKANLVILKGLDDTQLRLKDDAPPTAKNLFSRLSWKPDGTGVFEVTHADRPDAFVRTTSQLIDDIRTLSRYAGVERKIFNPNESRIQGVSLQYHVSQEGRNLDVFLGKLNRMIAAERLNRGVISDLRGLGRYRYQPNVEARGLVRSIEENHFEVRAHYGLLEKEIAFVKKALDSGPDGLKMLDQATERFLAGDGFRRIMKFNPEFAHNYQDILTPEQANQLRAFSARIALLNEKLAAGDPAAWRRLPALLKAQDPSVLMAGQNAFRKMEWPSVFLEMIPRMLQDDQGLYKIGIAILKHPSTKTRSAVALIFANEANQNRTANFRETIDFLTDLEWDSKTTKVAEQIMLSGRLDAESMSKMIDRYSRSPGFKPETLKMTIRKIPNVTQQMRSLEPLLDDDIVNANILNLARDILPKLSAENPEFARTIRGRLNRVSSSFSGNPRGGCVSHGLRELVQLRR